MVHGIRNMVTKDIPMEVITMIHRIIIMATQILATIITTTALTMVQIMEIVATTKMDTTFVTNLE